MLIDKLGNEISTWKSDKSVLVSVPLTEQVYIREKIRSDVEIIIELIGSISNGIERRPIVGFCYEEPKRWIIATLACLVGQAIAVPIPREFTLAQIASFAPNLDVILTDSERCAAHFSKMKFRATTDKKCGDAIVLQSATVLQETPNLPPGAIGVIHTSGSTNSPKGVVITEQGLGAVVESMLKRVESLVPIHYVSVLPYSLLLEQLLGVYLPVFTKGSISVLPKEVPCYTGVQIELDPYLRTIRESKANFCMVPPSFLEELRKRCENSGRNPRELIGVSVRAVATGGAPIDVECLEYFRDHGIDIFQGYGLSENTSVVSWTYPTPNVLGSVGTPLKHNKVRINELGQIEVSGISVSPGYVIDGEFVPRKSEWLNTGDNGFITDEGLLYVTGRDSNLLVLSSGRNVAPEWIEKRFRQLPGVKDILAVGHGRPFISALALVEPGFQADVVLDAVAKHAKNIAAEFPEFARVRELRAVPFSPDFYSVSGRILRGIVLKHCSNLIDEIYKEKGAFECKTISL